MWTKPDSEELLPTFMQSAMGFFNALAVFFGLPAITACALMRYNHVDYTYFPAWYMYALNSIFKDQNVFYLMHLVPAMAMRFICGKKLKAGNSLLLAAFLFAIALVLLYPVSSVLNPRILKSIAVFIMVPPLLMTFFILRIHRLLTSGSIVIVIFLGLLCMKFLK
jgi:hypothetical protein